MKIISTFVLALLFIFPLYAQHLKTDFGVGYGYILGSPKDAHSLDANIIFYPKKKWGIGLNFNMLFGSNQDPEYRYPSPPPTIIDDKNSNLLCIGCRMDSIDFQRVKNILPSKIEKDYYGSIDLRAVYTFLQKNRWTAEGSLGLSLTLCDEVTPIYGITHYFDNNPFIPPNWVMLVVWRFRRYIDWGLAYHLNLNYRIYKNLSVGLGASAKRYMNSEDGFYHFSVRCSQYF
jgi:hypothetical protein